MFRTLSFAVLLLTALPRLLHAAEYPWFKAHGFEGWIEYAPGASTDRRINVLPRLYGPSFVGEFGGATVNTSNLLSVKPDGEIILRFLVMGDRGKLPTSFKDAVYSNLQISGFVRSGFTRSSLDPYQVVIPKITNLRALLVVNGETKQIVQVPPNTFTNAEYTGEFRIRPEDEIYGNIRNADFKIVLDYEFPYQTFSGASLNLSQTILTTVKVEVFRQVIRKVKKSGTKILMFDFRDTYVKTIEKERITSNATADYRTNVDIVLRDPDEATLKFMDELMGKQEISKQKLIEQHEKLIALANQNNNPALGKLSKEYIDAVKADDPVAQVNVLDAVAALAKEDILGFIASGISFSESSAGGSYTYNAFITSTYSSTAQESWSQHVIKTARYQYQTSLSDFPLLANVIRSAQEEQMQALFGTSRPLPSQVDQTLARMTATNNLQNARYCLQLGANPNQTTGPDRDPLLFHALRSRYYPLATLLLKNGADPNLRNRHGEDCTTLLDELPDDNLKNLIRTALPLKGTTTLLFSITPPGPNFHLEQVLVNCRSKSFVLTPSANGANAWTSGALELYPGFYDMEISLTTSYLLPRNSILFNNPYDIQRYTAAGYVFMDNGNNKVKISKTVLLYDRVKVLRNGSNNYSYTLSQDPGTLAYTEAENKHFNYYDPMPQGMGQGNPSQMPPYPQPGTGGGNAQAPDPHLMFNFEKH